MQIPLGRWSDQGTSIIRDGIGLLVLQGLLIRRVGIDGRFGAELLGEGDLLRPWQGQDVPPTLPRTTGWRVLEPTRVALLDPRAAQRLARYPELMGVLVARALERSRNLAVNMAIVHQPRVDVRLHMLLWQLADRWGRVRSDGVRLPLQLTHAVLADLVAARRPTVTSALSELADQRSRTRRGFRMAALGRAARGAARASDSGRRSPWPCERRGACERRGGCERRGSRGRRGSRRRGRVSAPPPRSTLRADSSTTVRGRAVTHACQWCARRRGHGAL